MAVHTIDAMKDKTKILYTRKIQITRSEPAYAELDHMMFLSKNLLALRQLKISVKCPYN